MPPSESRPAAPASDLSTPQEDAGADAVWVRSFLRTQPGKTYRIEPAGDGHQDATREAAVGAARALTDEVVRVASTQDAPGRGDGG